MSGEWWRGAVLYQIYPRSFADANGDGVGDLAGIRQRLPYVASLGVDGIWLSPFFPSPMRDHGYDVSDYGNVDPQFGTLADFDALLADAHALGLKVIIDQVYSHSSDQHPWFTESRQSRDNPKADWYVWADAKPDGTPPNNWLAVFGGPAWTWDSRRRQYYFHNFLPQQPDLNFHNKSVQAAVLAAAEFWLQRGVDGFRIDVANLFCHDPRLADNPAKAGSAEDRPYRMQWPVATRDRPETLAFVARFRALLDRYPQRMAVAELASSRDSIATMIEYTDGPDRYHTAYSFVLLREDGGANTVRRTLNTFRQRSATAWPSWAFSNHDVVRVVSRWAAMLGTAEDDPRLAQMLIALVCCLRGTIFLYQGEELGLPHAHVPFERMQDPEGRAFWPRHLGRDGARTPMPWIAEAPNAGFCPADIEPWLPVDARHAQLAVDRQASDPASTLSFTRTFLAWRKRQLPLIDGDLRFCDVADPLLVFERFARGGRIFCAFNLGSGEQPLSVSRGARSLTAPGALRPTAGERLVMPPFAMAFWTIETGER